jgi:hypothetical protein
MWFEVGGTCGEDEMKGDLDVMAIKDAIND